MSDEVTIAIKAHIGLTGRPSEFVVPCHKKGNSITLDDDLFVFVDFGGENDVVLVRLREMFMKLMDDSSHTDGGSEANFADAKRLRAVAARALEAAKRLEDYAAADFNGPTEPELDCNLP